MKHLRPRRGAANSSRWPTSASGSIRDAESQDSRSAHQVRRVRLFSARRARRCGRRLTRRWGVPPVSLTIARAVRRRSSACSKTKRTGSQTINAWRRMAAARSCSRLRRSCLVLRHRPSADAPCVPIIEKYARQDVGAWQLPNRSLTALGGPHCRGAARRVKEDQQTLRDGDARDLEGSGAGPLHEQNYDKYRDCSAYPRDPRRQRSQHRRRQAEDIPAGSCRWRTRREITKQVHLRLHTAHLTPDTWKPCANWSPRTPASARSFFA